jgi:hypothetical protein
MQGVLSRWERTVKEEGLALSRRGEPQDVTRSRSRDYRVVKVAFKDSKFANNVVT